MIKEDLVVGIRDVNHRAVSNFLVTVNDGHGHQVAETAVAQNTTSARSY